MTYYTEAEEANDMLSLLEDQRDRANTRMQLAESALYRMTHFGNDTRINGEMIAAKRREVAYWQGEYLRLEEAVLEAVSS